MALVVSAETGAWRKKSRRTRGERSVGGGRGGGGGGGHETSRAQTIATASRLD